MKSCGGFNSTSDDGFEADDLIAVVQEMARAQGTRDELAVQRDRNRFGRVAKLAQQIGKGAAVAQRTSLAVDTHSCRDGRVHVRPSSDEYAGRSPEGIAGRLGSGPGECRPLVR